MPIRYGWLVNQQVILTRMDGVIAKDIFRQWADEVNIFYDQIPYDCLHIIVDATHLEKIPNIKEMLDIPVHAKRGWFIIYGMSNPLLQFFASTVVQVTRTELKFVKTLGEAVEVLQRVDQSLPDQVDTSVEWIGEIEAIHV